MPSSRGGGFSGGGGGHHGGFSSGGGHHSNGSGGKGGPRFSSHPFSGGRKYSYVNRRGRTRFFFYGGVPQRRRNSVGSIMVSVFIIILGLLVGGIMLYALIPVKLSSNKCTPISSYYEDNANVFTETEGEELEKTLKAFYKKTGVQPYLLTFYYEDFSENYGPLNSYTLEQYAYDKYINMFLDDEGHWLIVLAINQEENAQATDKWIWCEMTGDDAKRIVTDSLFSSFQSDMQTFLNADSISMGDGINRAYSNVLDDSLKVKGNDLIILLFLIAFLILFIGIPLVGIIRSIVEIKRVNEYCDYRDRTSAESDSSEIDLFD